MQFMSEFFVSYSQIAVFWPDLKNPFNPWTDEQVQLGFSQRPGRVSFKTSVESGTYSLKIIDGSLDDLPDNERIATVEVPFEVPENGEIEIALISDSCIIPVTAGAVRLRFEKFDDHVVRLSFLRKNS